MNFAHVSVDAHLECRLAVFIALSLALKRSAGNIFNNDDNRSFGDGVPSHRKKGVAGFAALFKAFFVAI